MDYNEYSLLYHLAIDISKFLSDRNLRFKKLSPIAKTYSKFVEIEVKDKMVSYNINDNYYIILFAKETYSMSGRVNLKKITDYLENSNTFVLILNSYNYYSNLDNARLIKELYYIITSLTSTITTKSIIDKYYQQMIDHHLLYTILDNSFEINTIIESFKFNIPDYIEFNSINFSNKLLENDFKSYSILNNCNNKYIKFLEY